ncbi:unnamed protein product [Ectocarpus fasciculatus]
MSSCDDLFYLNVDYSSIRDGCYELRTAATINGENAYFLDGIEEDVGSSVVYAEDGIADDNLVWVLANVEDFDGVDWETTGFCRDAALGDASTQHPSEVAQWDCYSSEDDAYTRLDEITITCSCGTTPTPTAGTTLAPSTSLITTPFPTTEIIVTPEPITPTPGPSTPLITTPFPTSESRAIVVTPAPTTPTAVPSTTPIAAPSPTSESEGNASVTPFTMSPLPEGSANPATVASSGGGDTSTMGAVAGAVGGGLVIGVIAVVALLFKTGRLKPCRNGNSNEPPPGVGSTPAAAPATSSAIAGTQLPAARQYPVPLQT